MLCVAIPRKAGGDGRGKGVSVHHKVGVHVDVVELVVSSLAFKPELVFFLWTTPLSIASLSCGSPRGSAAGVSVRAGD